MFFNRSKSLKPRRKSIETNHNIPAMVEMLEVRQLLSNYAVTTTTDNGDNVHPTAGSLRAAIISANNHSGFDTISFSLPSSGGNTIQPVSPLPGIADRVEINGNGSSSAPKLVIDGSLVNGDGLDVFATNSNIHGLIIENFKHGAGLQIEFSATNCQVSNNWLGTDQTGKAAAPNMFGIQIFGDHTIVSGNVISGNSYNGIDIQHSNNASIYGNTIGLDVSKSAKLGSQEDGILIFNGNSNLIGIPSKPKNIISGNADSGVAIAYGYLNLIQNNLIGLDGTGTKGFGNNDGVFLNGAYDNWVGGNDAGDGNVISGNAFDGVNLGFVGTHDNAVAGNLIGTDQSGTHAIPNVESGVYIAAGASNNLIGGGTAASRNVISGNGSGVVIDGRFLGNSTVDGHASGNDIFGNLIGVDISGAKALPNLTNGVEIFGGSTNNQIGGLDKYMRNTISGNLGDQISIHGAGTKLNNVQRNYIGVDSTGLHAVKGISQGSKQTIGVDVYDGATKNEIGGKVVGTGNVISNLTIGVRFSGAGTSFNEIDGNAIGISDGGKTPILNQIGVDVSFADSNHIGFQRGNVISGNGTGIVVEGSGGTIIGYNDIGTDYTGKRHAGPNFGNNIGIDVKDLSLPPIVEGGDPVKQGSVLTIIEYNVISGNTSSGLVIEGVGTIQTAVWSNHIGTDVNGNNFGNGQHGVFITDGASQNEIGGTGLTNQIAYNALDGILIGSDPAANYKSPAGNGNEVFENSIFSNGKVGIDLGPDDGRSPLYFGLPAGPNDTINAPSITVSTFSNGKLTVAGEFYSPVDTDITIQVYLSPQGTGSQGKTFIGQFVFHAKALNISTFSHTFTNVSAVLGDTLTTTAANLQVSTSEFSSGVQVTKPKK